MTYLLHNLKKKDLFLHVDLKPIQVWEHLIWMDHYNYGGIVYEEDQLDSPMDSIDFKWNLAEYLPLACKTRFIQITAEYIYEIQQFLSREKDNQENSNDLDLNKSKTNKEIQEELIVFLKKMISTSFKRKLLTMVREISRQDLPDSQENSKDNSKENLEENQVDPYEFPQLAGSHLNLKNPALEFIKYVSEFFSLDVQLSRESRLLRRDMLNLIGMREFSQETVFVNPCESFTLAQVICDFCNHCQDLDLTRGQLDSFSVEDSGLNSNSNSTSMEYKKWSCSACNTFYDSTSIEQRLVNIVSKRLLVWQLQDLKCEHCKLVRAEEIRDHCSSCSGKLNTELNRLEFIQKMKVFMNIAHYHDMPILKQVMEWVELVL